ncbi:unnamed protein product [Microthlaspi erraticum]|uniref:Uncharacterized protein n=1 Tax=Microthlaspi erraticum TaxID=1685480 RepID=A0A6D2HF58_9BRAS|nr:unnamed protein product [Microthlaspi erraticum]
MRQQDLIRRQQFHTKMPMLTSNTQDLVCGRSRLKADKVPQLLPFGIWWRATHEQSEKTQRSHIFTRLHPTISVVGMRQFFTRRQLHTYVVEVTLVISGKSEQEFPRQGCFLLLL